HGGQSEVLVGDIAQAKGDGDAVEAVIGKGQVLGVRLGKHHVAGGAVVDELVAADPQHGVVDIRQHHQPLGADEAGELGGQVAGAAGDVQYPLARAHTGHLDGEVLPQAVDAPRHQVVHQIVLGGHGVEHPGDMAGLFRDRKSTRLNSSHVKISYA